MQKNESSLKINFKTTSNKAFQIFEATEKRTEHLKLIYEALLTIKPISTEYVRKFSLSSNVVTKIRSRRSDRYLNILIFSKNYFKSP